MNGQDKEFWEKRLTKLETLFYERWQAHDKRSEEIWTEIKGDIEKIYSYFDKLQCRLLKLPCHSMAIKVTLIMVAIGFLYTLVATGIWYAIRP